RLQVHGVQDHHLLVCEAVGIDPAWDQGGKRSKIHCCVPHPLERGYNGDNLLPFLVFVPREPNPIAPFSATVLVPSPWSTLRSSCFSAARCRTLATDARQSEPSSAHLAKTLYTVV